MAQSEYHNISFHPRFIKDLALTDAALNAADEPVYSTINVKGARPDMFFIVRLKPGVQTNLSLTPILAYCVTNDVIRVAFLGSDSLVSNSVTVIAY